MSLLHWLFFQNETSKLNWLADIPKSTNLVRRMQTLWTTTRENEWGDNEWEPVSEAPEGPALGDYYSNGMASAAAAAHQGSSFFSFFFGLKRACFTDLSVFTSEDGRWPLPSGGWWILRLRWTPETQSPVQTVVFVLTMSICRQMVVKQWPANYMTSATLHCHHHHAHHVRWIIEK